MKYYLILILFFFNLGFSVSRDIGKMCCEDSFSSPDLSIMDATDIYRFAYDSLVSKNYTEAEVYFKAFIGEYPKDPLASNAYYWLGETYYIQKTFQLAAISFARGYKKFPKGNKAIDNLFKLAVTFLHLDKKEDACAVFIKLKAEFPNAPKRISNRAKEYIRRARC